MIDIFRQCCFNRYFELEVAKAIKDKLISCPVYLSVGSEFIPPLLKATLENCGIKKAHIFPQHRGHSYFLTFTGKAEELALELCGSSAGCNKGFGGSASIGDITGEYKLYPHDGLLGSQVPIAVGNAVGQDKLVICILGDASAEEDYVLGALGWAVTKKCKILFICEDNGLSISTPTKERRSWNIVSVANSMDICAENISIYSDIDYLWTRIRGAISYCVGKHKPIFLNIEVERHLWHVGAGKDGEPKFDYLDNFREQLLEEYTNQDISSVENYAKEEIEKIWKNTRNCP